jgi:hypothetical protein
MILCLLIISQISIKAELAKEYEHKKLTIGDPFVVDLTVTAPQHTDISAPFIDSIEPFGVLDQKSKIVQEKGMETSFYKIKLAAFKTGELEIPEFSFLYVHDSITDTLASEKIPLNIESVMSEDMKDINDLKEAVNFPDYTWLIVAGIIIGCLGAAYLAYKFVKRIQTVRTRARPLPPPWIEAIAAIDNIPVKEWLEKGLIKKYYYALSEILKRYIERRFEFNAAEQTTTELVDHLKLAKVPLRDDFHRFFTRADMVKYAKLIPPYEEAQKVVTKVKDLINNTRPKQTGAET